MQRTYGGTLIGGPRAGQRVVTQAPTYQVSEIPPLFLDPNPRVTPYMAAPKVHTYRHRELYTDNKADHPIGLWVHEDLTLFEALSLLLRCYERTGG